MDIRDEKWAEERRAEGLALEEQAASASRELSAAMYRLADALVRRQAWVLGKQPNEVDPASVVVALYGEVGRAIPLVPEWGTMFDQAFEAYLAQD